MWSVMATHPNPILSVRQYMEMLQKSDVRYEYWDGEVVAMAGGSIPHGLIASNIIGALWGQLRGKDCKAFGSDLLVKEEERPRYFFPDVVIHCKGGRVDPSFPNAVLEPIVVFEVLSPSTEHVDRTKKFESYSRIRSLRHLVLVSQNQKLVEHFHRTSSDDVWLAKHLFEDGHELVLAHVECRLKVAEIYEGVDEIV